MAEENILEKRILEAAKFELREKGLRGASMRSVAARAGIAVGTIYNYVSNKEELFQQVLLSSWRRLELGLTKLMEEELPLREKLLQVGLLQIDFMSYHREIWWDIFTTEGTPRKYGSKNMRNQTYEHYLELVTQIIQKAQEQGEIKRQLEIITSKNLALAFIMLINSLKPYLPHLCSHPRLGQQGVRRPEAEGQALRQREQTVSEILDVFLYGLCM